MLDVSGIVHNDDVRGIVIMCVLCVSAMINSVCVNVTRRCWAVISDTLNRGISRSLNMCTVK